MYHVELRQFPHNFCRFNLTEQELRETILEPWVQGRWVELGERKWSPQQADLKVLEAPRMPVDQLSMGRGWRSVERNGQEVTETMLASVRAASSEGADSPLDSRGTAFKSDVELYADSLALDALGKLSDATQPLAMVWRLACERYPERSLSECLKLAQEAVGHLADSQLVVLLVGRPDGSPGSPIDRDEAGRRLRSVESWAALEGSTATVYIRKA